MQFLLNKKSVYGSARANIAKNSSEVVWGVLYHIDPRSISDLDKYEVKYQKETVNVKIKACLVKAITYISTYTTEDERAYEDYKETIIHGAQQHSLPDEYIEFLKQLPTKSKPINQE